jgi:hypothetical protein
MIIIYIHVCQKGEWIRSLNMLFTSIVTSNLYYETYQIRVGIVNDDVKKNVKKEFFIVNKILLQVLKHYNVKNSNNLRIVSIYNCKAYERPTLLQMRNLSFEDEENAKYLYLHTKGIRWFNTVNEECVVDWIKLLLYWNVTMWKKAIEVLDSGYDTYGCNYVKTNEWPQHYSGNFFWTKSSYIRTLSSKIGSGYNDPEFWILSMNPVYYNSFGSGFEGMGHYTNRFPEILYIKENSSVEDVNNVEDTNNIE